MHPPADSAWERALDSREPAPQRVQAEGLADFVLPPWAAAAELPWLDGDAVAAWAGALPDEGARARAVDACRRAWLLHLRDALGPHYLLHETDEAYVLSSLELVVARATAA